jgi:hypothetical protein
VSDTIQRYDMEPECTLDPMNAEMRRSGVGDYVLHTDHLAAMAKLERSDLVEGLREAASGKGGLDYGDFLGYCDEAADEIDRLHGLVDELLQKCDESDDACYGTLSTSFVRAAIDAARKETP